MHPLQHSSSSSVLFFPNDLCDDMECVHKALLLNNKYYECYLEKITWALAQIATELSASFHGMTFLLDRVTGRQAMIIQTWVFDRYFLKD
jgi:hypothetical protein